MKNSKLKVCLLVSLSLLASCGEFFNNSVNNSTNPLIKNNIVKIPAISGKVEFSSNVSSPSSKIKDSSFTTKATISDIATQATVSLLYPSDHSNVLLRNVTVGTGLTDNLGKFTINPLFSPVSGDVFILEARKRLGGDGNAIISVKTFLQWNGTSWDSITNPGIYINAKTTAVAMIAGYNPLWLSSSDAIKKISVDGNGNSVLSNINTNVTASKISEVENLVNMALANNQDPVLVINNSSGVFSIPGPAPTSSGISGITERASFNGRVYDIYGVPVPDSTIVRAHSLEPDFVWAGEDQLTMGGAYVFRNAPVGVILEISAICPGWTTRKRSQVISSNLAGDPLINMFDFGGSNQPGASLYAIQDEPEITSVRINTKQATGTGTSTKPTQSLLASSSVNLTGVTNENLSIEFAFSEPIDKTTFENGIRVTSQLFSVLNNTGFVVDSSSPNVSFIWVPDRRAVTFNTNKAMLANQDGSEAKYMLDFSQTFRDDTAKGTIAGKYIGFSLTTYGDYVVYSVANN